MTKTIRTHTTTGDGTDWYCPNCSKRNTVSTLPSTTDNLACLRCGAEFRLGFKKEIHLVFNVTWLNTAECSLKTRTVSLWGCPICTHNNEYLYKVRLGDTLKCDKCTSELMIDKVINEAGEYGFTLRKQ